MNNAQRQKKYRANLVNVKSATIESLRLTFEIAQVDNDIVLLKKYKRDLQGLLKKEKL